LLLCDLEGIQKFLHRRGVVHVLAICEDQFVHAAALQDDNRLAGVVRGHLERKRQRRKFLGCIHKLVSAACSQRSFYCINEICLIQQQFLFHIGLDVVVGNANHAKVIFSARFEQPGGSGDDAFPFHDRGICRRRAAEGDGELKLLRAEWTPLQRLGERRRKSGDANDDSRE